MPTVSSHFHISPTQSLASIANHMGYRWRPFKPRGSAWEAHTRPRNRTKNAETRKSTPRCMTTTSPDLRIVRSRYGSSIEHMPKHRSMQGRWRSFISIARDNHRKETDFGYPSLQTSDFTPTSTLENVGKRSNFVCIPSSNHDLSSEREIDSFDQSMVRYGDFADRQKSHPGIDGDLFLGEFHLLTDRIFPNTRRRWQAHIPKTLRQ